MNDQTIDQNTQPDIGRVKRNVARMASQNAPETDIDGYIASEGFTVDQIAQHKLSDDDKQNVFMEALGKVSDIMLDPASLLGDTPQEQMAGARTALKGASFGLSTNVLPAEIASPIIFLAKNLFTDDKVTYGQARDFAYETANKDIEQYREDHPVLSPALEIGGAVATGTGIAKGVQNAGQRAATLPVVDDIARAGGKAIEAVKGVRGGNAAVQVGKGAVAGGLGAGAYGAGTNPEGDFVEGFTEYAPTGAAIGGGVGGLIAAGGAIAGRQEPIERAGKEVTKQFKNRAEKFFAAQLAKRPDLRKALDEAETLDEAAELFGINLTTAEKLAFTGRDPLLMQQGVLSGNAQTGGRMAALRKERSGQIETAYENLAKGVSGSQTYDEAAEAVLKHAEEGVKRITKELVDEASPLYKEAFKSNKSISSKILDNILDSPEGKKALRHAVKTMQNRMRLVATPDKELKEAYKTLSAVGKVKQKDGQIAQGFKLETLDLVKRGFDDAIDDALSKSMPGKASQEAKDLMQLRSAFVRELDKADKSKKVFVKELGRKAGAYERGRRIYSSQPDKLAMRSRAGNLADINADQPQKVASTLMSGTQKTAAKSAEALGEQGRAEAGGAVIRNALETNRGAPENIVKRLAPNDRAAEQLAQYLKPEQVEALERISELSRRSIIGNRIIHNSVTQPLQKADNEMVKAASEATGAIVDVKTGGATALLRRLARAFGAGTKEESPQFYEDMFELMTTPRGMQLARIIADSQERALQAGTKPLPTGQAAISAGEAAAVIDNTGKKPQLNKVKQTAKEYVKDESGAFDMKAAQRFAGQVKSVLSGKFQKGRMLSLGQTPKVLTDLGAPQTKLLMSPSKVGKILQDHPEMTPELIEQIAEKIHSPLYVTKSLTENNAMVAVLELITSDGRPVVAAVHLGKKGGRSDINVLASAYGKDNFAGWIAREKQAGRVLYKK